MPFNILLSFLFVITLTACGSSPKVNVLEIKDREVITLKVNPTLTEPCKPNPPIATQDYLLLKPHEKEQYLTDYVIHLLSKIKECNDKLHAISKL